MSTALKVVKSCPLSASVKMVAQSQLRRSGLCVCGDETGAIVLRSASDIDERVEPISIEDAWRGGALNIQEDGGLVMCGRVFNPQWDQTRIRRKLEDRLRKISTTGELIKVAACLGVEIH